MCSSVHSQPKLVQRKMNKASAEDNQILSSSTENEDRSSFSAAGDDFDLKAYYGALRDFYAVLQPLLGDRFMDDLPRTLVCVLSGRQDCGQVAELTKAVSQDLLKPLLPLVSSLRSPTCRSPPNTHGEPQGPLKAHIRPRESTGTVLTGLQGSLLNTLSGLPLSGSLMSVASGFVDTTVTYVLKSLAMLLQTPMDYLRIALQFGIRIPSLDQTETCEQGKTLFLKCAV